MTVLAISTAIIGGIIGAVVAVIVVIVLLTRGKKNTVDTSQAWTPPPGAQGPGPAAQPAPQQPFQSQPAPAPASAPAPQPFQSQPAPAPQPQAGPGVIAQVQSEVAAPEEAVVETAAQSTTENPDEIVRGKTMAMNSIDFESMLAERNKKK